MPACERTYIVREGDTLERIARRLDTGVAELLAANPGLEPERLMPGMQLCVPGAALCPLGAFPYLVEEGDTFAALAERFGSSVAALQRANPQLAPEDLRPGDVLCILTPEAEPFSCPEGNLYVIREGDTLWQIAQAFGLSVAEIRAENPQLDPEDLQPDTLICLPLAPVPVSIVVNLAARTLTLLRQGLVLREYPVAVGKPETPTPTGEFRVINKQLEPGGPFGTRWLGLSVPGYGIHGTNAPSSIGTAASNGCIRMQNADVEQLFNLTPLDTPVRILP